MWLADAWASRSVRAVALLQAVAPVGRVPIAGARRCWRLAGLVAAVETFVLALRWRATLDPVALRRAVLDGLHRGGDDLAPSAQVSTTLWGIAEGRSLRALVNPYISAATSASAVGSFVSVARSVMGLTLTAGVARTSWPCSSPRQQRLVDLQDHARRRRRHRDGPHGAAAGSGLSGHRLHADVLQH